MLQGICGEEQLSGYLGNIRNGSRSLGLMRMGKDALAGFKIIHYPHWLSEYFYRKRDQNER